jgi:tetratricopeptide (TPR) repeat protein
MAGVLAGVSLASARATSHTSQIEQAHEAFRKGDALKAIEISKRALEHGENAELRNILGKAYVIAGQPEMAILELQSAVRLRPYNENYQFDLAQLLLKTQKFSMALAALEDAHQHLPESVQIELALGVAYYVCVRYDDAVRAFLRIMELSPDVPQPYLFLGRMLGHAEKHLDEIAAHCLVSERVDPSNPYAPMLHAKVLIAQLGSIEEKQKADAAVNLLKKTIALKSDWAEPYFILGSLMVREQNYAQAVRFLEKSVQLNPNDPTARYRLGLVYTRLGNRARADEEFAAQARLKNLQHHRPTLP